MKWALCTSNDGCRVSLLPMKLYRIIDDTDSAAMGCIRVIDETGEDYAFPDDLFLPLEFSPPIDEKLLALSWQPVELEQSRRVTG
ncbi:MAG: hypothetical protein LBU43_12905 [Candidatus Accumulibacter sp.]|jgi:hypothetical protein|nr:hypothetical protein [Accumulibacter sp.]